MKQFFSLLLVAFVQAQELPERPNFVLLFPDDLGYGDLGIQGSPTILTPHLDQFSRDGIRFTQFYTSMGICSPSRASLLTGRYSIRSGCAGENFAGHFPGAFGVFPPGAIGGFPLSEITLPEALREVGYNTTMIGKWHLGDREQYLPTNHGFESYFGIPFSNDMGGSFWWEEDRGYTPCPLLEDLLIVEQPVNMATLTGRYTDRAVEYIHSHAKVKGKRQNPFFMYLAWAHPHIPNFCAPSVCGISRRGPYGDSVVEIDISVGAIVQALKDAEIEEDTLVFFVSDNGPWLEQGLEGGSAGLLRNGKGTTWEGGIRVPAMARWPGVIPSGQVSLGPGMTTDVFTTMLSLADVPIPTDREVDGFDLTEVLLDGSTHIPRDCLFHYNGTPDPAAPEDFPGLWAIRCGQHKAHYWTLDEGPGGSLVPPMRQNPPLLFDMSIDPSEQFPIDPLSQEYRTVMEQIDSARIEHLEGVEDVPNEMAKGRDPQYMLCCDPNSQIEYPQFPACTCNPENWNPEAQGFNDLAFSQFSKHFGIGD